ncbi:MAG TPA: S1 RNA-binding domain-containing protein, partial [Terriglobales bacterium]|nr:S1 RNA-binding domain-containing protein [Terriglobales bacterium]
LGLKQALGDPWAEIPERFSVGSIVEGPVTSLTNFGAFIQLSEGVDGMVHISDITPDRRIRHPREVLRVGQTVKAQVLAVDKTRRQLRLGMKQLLPTGWDEYFAEHKPGDLVTGRITQISETQAGVELGEGIQGMCQIAVPRQTREQNNNSAKADLSSLRSMLESRWKGGATGVGSEWDQIRAGQVRKFRIVRFDPGSKQIELELA